VFLSEAGTAWADLKAGFDGDREGWTAKCEELVDKFDLEKADLVRNANQWSEGHAGLMEMTMEKLATSV
jgi:hypothetical protein